MPPRRSCFADFVAWMEGRYGGFNATTAFLLRGSPGDWPGAGRGVSMPPRRSCFTGGRETMTWIIESFNATTAFLLHCSHDFDEFVEQKFQCHHGVPASCGHRRISRSERSRFNATTAFLLRGRGRELGVLPIAFQCHHGVPASSGIQSGPPAILWFQCHHGVPASREREEEDDFGSPVSMPPRRSCFLNDRFPNQLIHRGFNATTAFLLPVVEVSS